MVFCNSGRPLSIIQMSELMIVSSRSPRLTAFHAVLSSATILKRTF